MSDDDAGDEGFTPSFPPGVVQIIEDDHEGRVYRRAKAERDARWAYHVWGEICASLRGEADRQRRAHR
jgi:hypothetical protein